ncbi:M15 family metallopeptidase [Heyndrickxia vini]|uniref:M15 family metallopeptidase n=1 Tax=Heyndrickxia vini TaxID=1476025 RepID=A0ABX7E5U8_9BACI|nr:M15 family metallopeptidase [Heyndrickxia vini]QQZ11116.1 M15 family metallopeptidase [Heyndrickxia vini]
MKRIITITSVLLLLSGCSWGQNDNIVTKDKKDSAQSENNSKVKNHQNVDSDLLLESKYFNQIKDVNGQKLIENSSNILALVNKTYSIGSYIPNDLVRPNVQFSFGDQDIEKSYMRKEAANALEKMFQNAKSDGIELYASSGYRSYKRQKEVLNAEIANVGKEKAVQAVATPGQSEHQTGLAMDITSQSENFLLTESFEKQKEGIWLRKHAHEYGFILRYPKGKEKITGYEYEPWHFRYVGKKCASIIYTNNWTLEDYFKHVKKV